MKTLIVYFSQTGNTKAVAEALAACIPSAELQALVPQKPYPASRNSLMFAGGSSVVFHRKPKLAGPPIDWAQYDRVYIGTPVWAGSFAPPLRTLLTKNPPKGKQVALFACHAGEEAKDCLQKLKHLLVGNEVIGEISFVEPLQKGLEQAKAQIEAFAKQTEKA